MNKVEWINRFLKRNHKKNPPDQKMKISSDQAEKMIQMIQKTQEIELSCDDVHGLLDQYTEMAIRGEDVTSYLPLVHYHLDMCPDCREEYDALSRILLAQEDIV